MQALLSATNLLVGLLMIRRTSDLEYGYYVLAFNAMSLVVMLQNTFIQPQLVVRMTRGTRPERAALVGGIYRDQRRIWPLIPLGVGVAAALLGFVHAVQPASAVICAVAALAVAFSLYREYFRMVLLGCRRPLTVLGTDAVYAAVLIAGAWLATRTPWPAAFAVLSIGVAAAVGGWQGSRALWRFEPWNLTGAPGILREFAPLGVWAAGGAGVHWLFSQGYNYLVAGLLSVQAGAARPATRLTIMPRTLVSTGLGTMLLPTVAGWLHTVGARRVLRRMRGLALVLTLGALCYCAVIWAVRDWLFAEVLKKTFAQRDDLLLMWFAVSLVTLLRDQLLYLLTVRGRFRIMSSLTLVSALTAMGASYFGVLRWGVLGALLGILIGELLNVCGLIYLSVIEARNASPAKI